jgi:aryl-alcohol dehydrogenase-like predicted oxidoreductase
LGGVGRDCKKLCSLVSDLPSPGGQASPGAASQRKPGTTDRPAPPNDKGRGIIAKTREPEPIAADLDCSTAQLAIAWCLLNPNVSTVILGASKIEQLDENLDALEVLPKLTDEIVERIEGVLQNRSDGPQRF